MIQKGGVVYIRDRPMGLSTNIKGKVMGVLSEDKYAVLLLNGLNEGQIIKYKYWLLKEESDTEQ